MDAKSDSALRRSTEQHVRFIHGWTDNLWSLRVDKPADFHFQPGHYARLGLPVADVAPLWRPYSIVSAPSEPQLEFLITLIPDGAFTCLLVKLRVGDPVLLESAALGFFFEPQLAPGEDLWMLSTGAGLGPYVSLLRTPQALARYRRLVLVHSVRAAAELAYADELNMLAAASGGRLCYLPVVTRETGATVLSERIPQLIADGRLPAHLGLQFDAVTSRVMVCGNPDFTADMRRLLNARGFTPCRRGLAGSMLFENYW